MTYTGVAATPNAPQLPTTISDRSRTLCEKHSISVDFDAAVGMGYARCCRVAEAMSPQASGVPRPPASAEERGSDNARGMLNLCWHCAHLASRQAGPQFFLVLSHAPHPPASEGSPVQRFSYVPLVLPTLGVSPQG